VASAVCALLVSSFARAEDDADSNLTLAPDNSDVLAVVEFADIIKSPAFQQIAKQFPTIAKQLDQPLNKETKLTPRKIDSVFVAANTTSQDFVVVINLNDEIEIDDLLSETQQAKETKIGDYSLFALEQDQTLCLVDESTIAVGPKKTLTAVLKRGGEAKLAEVLTSAWENIDENQQISIVAKLDKVVKQNSSAIPAGLPITPEMLAKLQTLTFNATTDAKQLTLSANLDCTDAETANQLKGLLDIILKGAQQDSNTPAEIKQALRGLKSSTDEEILAIDYSTDINLLIEQFKAQINEALTAGAQ
jgi:hypothetical protein